MTHLKKLFFLLCIFVSAGSSLKANCCFFGEIEYLYWNISQVNMPYAVAIEDINNFANFEEIKQGNHWTSGFRLGLGAKFCCDFETRLSWTSFHPTFKDRKANKILIASELLAPNIGFVLGGDDIGGPASSRWRLDFDTIDWDVGMSLCFKNAIRIFPYIGLKGAIIRQEQRITYEDFVDTNTDNRLDAFIKEKNSFYGVGPKLGLFCAYFLSSRWSLDGMLAASLLGGHQISPSVTSFTEPEAPLFYSSKFHVDAWRLIPFLQCYLGVSWQGCLCRCPFMVGVGYEAQMFWDLWRTQNSIIQQIYITDASYGALMLQGLAVKLKVSF